MSVEPSAVRPTSETRSPRQRSQVTNGRRSVRRRQWPLAMGTKVAATCANCMPDLCGGDLNSLSEAKRSLIKRASTIEIELEAIEGKLSEGKEADLGTYAMAAGHLKRILETLGIERVARDVTQSLDDILREYRRSHERRSHRQGAD